MRGLAVWLVLALAAPALAQEDFYRDRSIDLYIPTTAGGSFDVYGRLAARHLGRHIPGNPNVIVTGMAGAAGNTMAAYVATVAPRDGTIIGAPISTLPLAPILEDASALRYDPTKLQWLGSAAEDVFMCVVRRNGPLKTFADAFTTPAIMGGSSETSQTGYAPMLLNNILGTKFRVVYGYPGTRELMTSMERGEIDGLCSMGLTTLRTQFPSFLKNESITVLVQERVTGDREMDAMGVPRAGDFARTEDDKAILDMIYAQELFGRPYFVSGDVPADRVEALREAIMAAWRDPELLAEAQKTGLDVSPMSGQAMQQLLTRIYGKPDELKRRALAATRPPK